MCSIITDTPAPHAVGTAGKRAAGIITADIILKERTSGVMNRIGQIIRHKLFENICLCGIRHFLNDPDPLKRFQQGHLWNIGTADTGFSAAALGFWQIPIEVLKLIEQGVYHFDG
jgi:hypothetical protein